VSSYKSLSISKENIENEKNVGKFRYGLDVF